MTKQEQAENAMSELRKKNPKCARKIDEYASCLKEMADAGRDNSHSYDRVWHEAYGYIIALLDAHIIPLGDKNRILDYIGM